MPNRNILTCYRIQQKTKKRKNISHYRQQMHTTEMQNSGFTNYPWRQPSQAELYRYKSHAAGTLTEEIYPLP